MDSKYGVLKFYFFFTRLFFANVVSEHFKSPETETHKKTKAGVIELVMIFYQAQKTRFLESDVFTKLQFSTVTNEILNDSELKASNEWLKTTFETQHQEQICIMLMNLFESGVCINFKDADFSTVATVCKNSNAETYIKTMVVNILFHPFIDFGCGCDEDDEASRAIFEALNDRVLELDALYRF